MSWREEVELQSGEVIVIKRTAKFSENWIAGGGGGSFNLGMTIEFDSPYKPNNSTIWSALYDPMALDQDPDTNDWLIIATLNTATVGMTSDDRSCLTRHIDTETKNGYSNQWSQNGRSEKPTLLLPTHLIENPSTPANQCSCLQTREKGFLIDQGQIKHSRKSLISQPTANHRHYKIKILKHFMLTSQEYALISNSGYNRTENNKTIVHPSAGWTEERP